MATEKFANKPITTLSTGITISALTLSVKDVSAFPLQPQFRIKIEDELMLVTGVAGSVFTVLRGAENTVAAAHGLGATVVHVLTAGALDQLKSDVIGSGAQGNQGWQGNIGTGNQGWQGNTGAGVQGSQGNVGTGVQGNQGRQGGGGGGGGVSWHVLYDVDFTTLTSQALNTDGAHTLSDGMVWTKSGSAKDGTTFPWAIVNGTGLVTSAVGIGLTAFEQNDLSWPTLWPNLLLGTLTGISRIPIKISCIFGTVADSGTGLVGLALEARDTSQRVIASARRLCAPDLYQAQTYYSSETATVSAVNDNGFGNGETPRQNCSLLECPGGLFLGQALHYTAHTTTNDFPANAGASYRCRGVTPNPTTSLNNWNDSPAVWTPDNWTCSIINGMINTGSIAVVTRFKVEAYF
jgi:hypothetical protein